MYMMYIMIYSIFATITATKTDFKITWNEKESLKAED